MTEIMTWKEILSLNEFKDSRNKITKYIENLLKKGYKLKIDETLISNNIDKEHFDYIEELNTYGCYVFGDSSIYYSGYLFSIISPDGRKELELRATGDILINYINFDGEEVRMKVNSYNYCLTEEDYFEEFMTVREKEKKGEKKQSIEFHNNNWIYGLIVDLEGKEDCFQLDTVGDILEVIEEFKLAIEKK